MDNIWRVEMVAECQRRDAVRRAEMYRLIQVAKANSKVQGWPQKLLLLIGSLVGFAVDRRVNSEAAQVMVEDVPCV